jgi:magnesium-transporting ATPase (P-type)
MWQSVMLAIIALIAYAWALSKYGPGEHARTIAFLVLIGVQIGQMMNCRSRRRSLFNGMFTNPMVWLASLIVISLQLAAVYFEPLARVLGTVSPSTFDWAVVVSCVLLPVAIVESTKLIVRRKRSNLSSR